MVEQKGGAGGPRTPDAIPVRFWGRGDQPRTIRRPVCQRSARRLNGKAGCVVTTADEPVVPPQGIELWRYQGRQSLHRVLCSPGAHGGMVYGLEMHPANAKHPATVVWRRDVGDLITLVLRALAQPTERRTEVLVEYPSGSLLLFRWAWSRLRIVRAGNHAPDRASVVWHG